MDKSGSVTFSSIDRSLHEHTTTLNMIVDMNNTSRSDRLLVRMMTISVVLWLAFASVNANSRSQDTVLVLGDSISSAYGLTIEEGWVAQLQNTFDEKGLDLNVVNASVTGDTTANGLGRLSGLLAEYEPRMLIIELGGNDGLRGLSVENLKANLISMAELANDYGAIPVVVSVQLPGNYGKAYNNLFASAFITAAEDTNAALVPSLFEGMDASAQWFQSDGIHPSASAQPLMLANVWKVIEPLLEEESQAQ